MKNSLPIFLITTIWCGSFLIALTPIQIFYSNSVSLNYLYLFMSPVLFIISFISIAASLSRLAQKGIVPGTFPREPLHKIYFLRRIYGACWTQVYYFKPLYAIALSIPLLKKYLFRCFGYKHSTNFTIYPDTWIRDLSILNIGEGAYLSNRATIGTNMCLIDGSILVDSVEVGEKTVIGHLAAVAPGSKFGANVEVGVNATIGIRTKLNNNCRVNPCCAINHGAVIGESTQVGTMSFVGLKAVLGPNLKIPAVSNIPAGSIINTQDEVDNMYKIETQKLQEHVSNLRAKLKEKTENDF